jgi:hypothetical protein
MDGSLKADRSALSSTRLSGKPVRTYDTPIETVCELAKRNAARQLLPLPEIKAVEKKYQFECEFSWEKAYNKCVELVGGKAQVDIIIYDLVKSGKIRQEHPSNYDRTEWLIIHDACKKDAESVVMVGDKPVEGWVRCVDTTPSTVTTHRTLSNDVDNNNDGGDNPPSSNNDDEWKVKLQECEDAAANEVRYCWIRSDLEREGILPKHPKDWQDNDFETLKQACALDASLFNRGIGDDWTLVLETNKGVWAYERRYRFWLITKDTKELREKCFVCGKTKSQAQMTDDLIHWERYYIKTVVCAECLKETTKADMTERFDELYHNGNGAINTDGLRGRCRGIELPSKTAEYFIARCREAIDKVREKKTVEANDQPLENGNGKRKLQMDKKLRTWLIESDGTKKEISCREICEQFKDGSIITRLRVGIDSGADISTVELDD